MLQVKKLRCEYLKNPVGIDVSQPRISWQVLSDGRAIMQIAYRIQVSEDPEFESIIWDSGKVISDQSVHMELKDLVVEARKRYYYRVQVWDNRGEESGWSEYAYWESGLLNSDEWKAEWISVPISFTSPEEEPVPLLRRTFSVRDQVKSARIYVTSLGIYELELNGNRVGENYFTPGWTSYRHRLQYQTYDVTELLEAGPNAIGALLGNGWYKGYLTWKDKKEIYGDRTALLLQLYITYKDGTEDIIVSDSDWKAAESPIRMSEIYHGEWYDARLEKHGWSSALYDDTSWAAVEVLPYSKDQIIAQENEPVRKIEEVKPVRLITTPKGETVLDMGQNMVGWVRFTVRGKAGQEVTLLHGEVLDREGNFYSGNLRSAKQTVRYILKGEGQETFEPHFTFQGFRYVKLIGFDNPIRLEDSTGVVLHSDMEPTGHFECSDPLVNQLQHNILWGQKGNFLDVPTDCPQRDERLGWTGDAQMFIRTASFLMNVAPFFTKWLRDLKADQLESGGVPFVIPNVFEGEEVMPEAGHSSSAWGDAAVICPWTLYLCYGDKRILEEQYDSMKAWVEYIRGQGKEECLWNTGFHFGDWLALDSKQDSYVGATDRDFIATAFYAYSVSLLMKTAQVLNRAEDYSVYKELHQRILAAFRKEFVTPAGRLSVPTQTANVLSLMFGLVDGIAEERAVRKLMELLKERDFHLTTGFVGTPYLNPVLSQTGNHEAACKLLFQTDYPSWLYQVKKGATTIWEHWDGIKEDGSFWSEDMNSFNHYAYGSIGDWLYRFVTGIQTDEERPGYKHVFIKPQPCHGLTWAEAGLETMYGPLHTAWKRKEGGALEVHVTIPPNTTASVDLPVTNETKLTESGVPIREANGIAVIKQTKSGIRLSIGSGDYHFNVN